MSLAFYCFCSLFPTISCCYFSNKFLLKHLLPFCLNNSSSIESARSQLEDIKLIPIWKNLLQKRLKNNWKNFFLQHLPVTFDELPSIFSTSFFYFFVDLLFVYLEEEFLRFAGKVTKSHIRKLFCSNKPKKLINNQNLSI